MFVKIIFLNLTKALIKFIQVAIKKSIKIILFE